MFGFLKRRKIRRFDLAAIGDNWLVRPLVHDGIAGTLHVRQLPAGVRRADFPVVALAWVERAEIAGEPSALLETVKTALEKDRACLTVLVHETPDRVLWYAYAAQSSTLDATLAALDNKAIRWGVNDDPEWVEYEHAKGLVGA